MAVTKYYLSFNLTLMYLIPCSYTAQQLYRIKAKKKKTTTRTTFVFGLLGHLLATNFKSMPYHCHVIHLRWHTGRCFCFQLFTFFTIICYFVKSKWNSGNAIQMYIYFSSCEKNFHVHCTTTQTAIIYKTNLYYKIN